MILKTPKPSTFICLEDCIGQRLVVQTVVYELVATLVSCDNSLPPICIFDDVQQIQEQNLNTEDFDMIPRGRMGIQRNAIISWSLEAYGR